MNNLVLAVCAALIAATSHSATSAAENPKNKAVKLEEVIVTAQKRPEDIQSVPVSVTAIGGDDLTDKNMGDMNEVANYVPNLDVLAVPTFPSIYLRGVGSSYNRGFEQSVAILIDEVFYGRASYINQGLLDLAAIEVLRGPQGTLFGKNASAGVIHFRTAPPEQQFGGKADVLLGALNHRRIRMAATGPLVDDTLAWRIALIDEQRDGAIENTTNGVDEENRDNRGIRLRFQWDASEKFSGGLILNGGEVSQQGAGSQLLLARGRALAAMRVFDPTTSDDVYDKQSAQDARGFADRQTWDVIAQSNYSLTSEQVITSITSYSWLDEDLKFDADFSPVPFLALDNDEDLRQFTQEFRLTSGPGPLEYVAGLFFLHTDLKATYDITNFLELSEILQLTAEGERRACVQSNDPQACQDMLLDDEAAGEMAGNSIAMRMASEGGTNPVETSFTRFHQKTISAGLFGQTTWHATDKVSMTLGLRLNYEEKELDVEHLLLNNRTGVFGNGVDNSNGAPIPLPSQNTVAGGSVIFPVILPGDTQFSDTRQLYDFNVIPKGSVQYQWRDDVMFYLTVAQGYKSGGYNAQPINDEQLEFDNELALNYELGVKSEWLGGAARVNVSVFRTEFDDLQVATFNGFSYVVGNAATAVAQGLEFDALMLTPIGILLSINGAFTDAEYESFPGAPCDAENVNPPPCDLSGRPLRLAPEIKSTFTVGYEGQPWDWPVIVRGGITASYTSEVPLATDLDPIDIRVDGTTIGLQLGLSSARETWSIALYGDNIFDHESLAGAQDAPAYRGTHFGGAYPDATYEIEFSYRF